MTAKDRARIRKLQDRILAVAERLELPWHMALSADLPSRITLEGLKHFLEPDYEAELRAFLAELESRT
jgi:hypothetical protein